MDIGSDVGLQSYFTDAEYIYELFSKRLHDNTYKWRILVIHGIGGIGKSSLLRIFRLHCKRLGIPVALASGDEEKSPIEILKKWADELSKDRVKLAKFMDNYDTYISIQLKIKEKIEKQKAIRQIIDTASKTVEAASGAIIGSTLGSIIPGIGTALGTAMGSVLGIGTGALTDWLHSFLRKDEIEFVMDPANKLTNYFIEDLKKRIPVGSTGVSIVIMLDTFEQLQSLSEWICGIVQQLPQNVLFVIAGRVEPKWDRIWPEWIANSHIEELKPMDDKHIRELIRKYCAYVGIDEPSSEHVDAIVRFSRGLPLVITSIIKLWKMRPDAITNFQMTKSHVIEELVDRLIENMPSKLLPAFEAVAILRWFNQSILRFMLERDDIYEIYEELRRFPFVRIYANGLAFHEAIREIFDERLRIHDPDRHRELHERAAAYFEKRIEDNSGEDGIRFVLEQLYHKIHANESEGIRLFQEIAESFVHYRLMNNLRTLLNDVNSYDVQDQNARLWIKYYNARLKHLEGGKLEEVAKIYEDIGRHNDAEPKLRAYALCDLAGILCRPEQILARTQPSITFDKVIEIINESMNTFEIDSKLVQNFVSLRTIYELQCRWDDARLAIERMRQSCAERNDLWGVANAYFLLRWNYTITGDFNQMLAMHDIGCQTARDLLDKFPTMKIQSLFTTLGWIQIGRYREVELNMRTVREILEKNDLNTPEAESEICANLGYALGCQRKFDEAYQNFDRAFDIRKKMGDEFFVQYWKSIKGEILILDGKLDEAEALVKESLIWKLERNERITISMNLNLLGRIFELRKDWNKAIEFYKKSIELNQGNNYLKCHAIIGLARIKYLNSEYDAAISMLKDVDELTQKYEYNDCMSFSRLISGHIAWERDKDFETALHYYREALICALRFNRFLLDDLLYGDELSIVSKCIKNINEGRMMLIEILDWWKGNNKVERSRPDTVCTIPEGLSLLEAERYIRMQEPGDGSEQKDVISVIEQIISEISA